MSLIAVTVDGAAVAASVSDQTIVVPLGGILPVGGTVTVRVRYRATLRSIAVGVELAVHPDERRGRPVPLAALGQPGARRSTGRTTATRSRRR